MLFLPTLRKSRQSNTWLKTLLIKHKRKRKAPTSQQPTLPICQSLKVPQEYYYIHHCYS